MKKINLKGKFKLNKQTVSRLNENEQNSLKGGGLAANTGITDSQMTVMDTFTCHCDDTDSQMTVMDTFTCHCDTLVKKCS